MNATKLFIHINERLSHLQQRVDKFDTENAVAASGNNRALRLALSEEMAFLVILARELEQGILDTDPTSM